MTTPILDAPLAVQAHAAAALLATALGAVQFVAPKGVRGHRLRGRVYVVLIVAMAASSLFIHEIRLWGPWSPLHALSVLTLVTLPFWIVVARQGYARLHAVGMIVLFAGGLMVAGSLAFAPGRRLGALIFGS